MKPIKEEPAGVGMLAALVYAALVMIWRVADGEPGAVFQPDVLMAGVAALWLLVTRYLVTPLAKPRDKEGRALRPAQQPPVDPRTQA